MNEATITIDVGICTFQREQVAFTLRSLAEMALPANCSLRVIVADNDTTPSAQVLVASTADALKLNVTYLHAPEANISIARNACLDAATAEYFGFIDDDEIVCIGWLNAMLARLRETNADIVLGPVRAVYPDGSPEWLRRGDFHSTTAEYVNGRTPLLTHYGKEARRDGYREKSSVHVVHDFLRRLHRKQMRSQNEVNRGVRRIITGYAGNVLMKRNSPALNGLRFRLDLGTSGGEDTDFFTRAVDAGARIEFAPDAAAFEGVPAERATLKWLIQRRYRFGQTHAAMLLANHPSPMKRRSFIALAAAKMLCCYVMIPVMLFDAAKKRYWLLRGMLHLGVVRTLINR